MDAPVKGQDNGMQLKPGGTAAGGPVRQAGGPPTSSREVPRILVVDDQEDVRRMLATALELEGYRVTEAADAQDGLERLAREGFNLILTDYAMPGGTGAWMLEEAARLDRINGAAAMIVTAHPEVRARSTIAVINKPFELDYFLDRVRELIASNTAPTVTPPSVGSNPERSPRKRN
jgi:CheY-like chemotaxis protein